MKQYIDKADIKAEIERLKECNHKICGGDFDFLKKVYPEHYYSTEIYDEILSFLDTLEVKEVDTWHLQEKEDIHDAVKDWGLYTFACLMKDGTIQRFTGFMDEDFEGHINTHIDGVDDDICNINDIVKWIEYT